MGGDGSGRWHQSARGITPHYRKIDVRCWQRERLLIPGYSFGWQWVVDGEIKASIQVMAETDHIILSYRHRIGTADWASKEYPVRLVWTPCAFGGKRAWFLCPAQGCGRRVAVLYGGGIFACRHCHKLAYPSQRETPDDRLLRRADGIRARLGWDLGILNASGCKPKGMHWRTFICLIEEHNRLVIQVLAGMNRRLETIQERIDGM